jgi:hypothetical protein
MEALYFHVHKKSSVNFYLMKLVATAAIGQVDLRHVKDISYSPGKH